MSLLYVFLLTLTPTLELRASIPYAIVGAGWHPVLAGAVGIIANSMLAPIVWVFVDRVMGLFLKIGWIEKVYDRVAARSVARLAPHVQKYGVLGLALFVGVPFPGTGVYSGCLAAWLLKFRFRDYLMASCLGCVLAGVAVTVVVALGVEGVSFLVKDLDH